MHRGTYIEHDGRPAVRFERSFPHPIERVWAAVSDPAELARWFPSAVEIEARTGGVVTFSGDPHMQGMAGVVLAYQPPRRLAFTWGQDELHLDLDPIDDTHCRLILVNVLQDRSAAARNAAGWSVCLAELDKLIDGRRPDGSHSGTAESWRPHYDAYVSDGMPSGAEIPTASTDR